MTNSIDAFEQFAQAVDDQDNTSNKAHQAKVAGKLISWLRSVPVSLLDNIEAQVDHARKVQDTSPDRVAGVVAFFAPVSAPTNGNAPVATLGGGSSAAPAAPESPSNNDTLTPREMSMLEKYRTFTPTRQTWWEDVIRDLEALSDEKKMGASNAIEDISKGKQEVDKLGRPLAEQDVNRLNRENDDLESANSSLTTKVVRLEKDLATARAATPTGTPPASDKLLMATVDTITFVNSLYGLRAPRTLSPTDEQAIISYLKSDFQTEVGNAAKVEGDKLNAATKKATDAEAKVTTYLEAAKTARTKLRKEMRVGNEGTVIRPKHKIFGVEAIDLELQKITGTMPELATS